MSSKEMREVFIKCMKTVIHRYYINCEQVQHTFSATAELFVVIATFHAVLLHSLAYSNLIL